jgi:hypothetical protein
VDTFLENAQRIFDVARTDSSAEASDFALLVRPDGSLHVIMESTVNPESAAIEHGAQAAYRVLRSRDGVTVSGRAGNTRCELSSGASSRPSPWAHLRDQPLYLVAGQGITSPLRIASAS